jgi:hypothetical protein
VKGCFTLDTLDRALPHTALGRGSTEKCLEKSLTGFVHRVKLVYPTMWESVLITDGYNEYTEKDRKCKRKR